MSSLHFEKFQEISFNLELYQKYAPSPMFMTLFLDRMGALSATKAFVAPRLPKPILSVLPMNRYNFQESNSQVFYKKSCFEVFNNIRIKTPVQESIFNKDAAFI